MLMGSAVVASLRHRLSAYGDNRGFQWLEDQSILGRASLRPLSCCEKPASGDSRTGCKIIARNGLRWT
ncbi:hypothetical protein QO004_000700 [Rhizobium mesoamericanum]|nr:hypothetical protein [Rhizobium mesoamericanum]